PSGYRTVFNMYVIEGFNHKEIGEKLNIAESSSRSQLAKSKKMLKKLITELYSDNG
ncbi:MAG TPA: RNA polymerase subunit sigma-70, partial [Bacteroidetes bacterium]|nr:RNA polymerase subunit sigma-70 [Bacteroidota bacterium]